jgi:hypothetical protein
VSFEAAQQFFPATLNGEQSGTLNGWHYGRFAGLSLLSTRSAAGESPDNGSLDPAPRHVAITAPIRRDLSCSFFDAGSPTVTIFSAGQEPLSVLAPAPTSGSVHDSTLVSSALDSNPYTLFRQSHCIYLAFNDLDDQADAAVCDNTPLQSILNELDRHYFELEIFLLDHLATLLTVSAESIYDALQSATQAGFTADSQTDISSFFARVAESGGIHWQTEVSNDFPQPCSLTLALPSQE